MNWLKGKSMPKYIKKKISLSMKGHSHSLEHNRKVGDALRGIPKSKQMIENFKKAHQTETYKEKIANYWTKEKRKERGEKIIGRKHSKETRIKMSNRMKREKNPNWKGGITPSMEEIRDCVEYKLWRESVFERDNFTCIWCGQRGGRLEADHVKSFADYPALRFAIDNGRTLCKECHKKTDSYGWKSINNKKNGKT